MVLMVELLNAIVPFKNLFYVYVYLYMCKVSVFRYLLMKGASECIGTHIRVKACIYVYLFKCKGMYLYVCKFVTMCEGFKAYG